MHSNLTVFDMPYLWKVRNYLTIISRMQPLVTYRQLPKDSVMRRLLIYKATQYNLNIM